MGAREEAVEMMTQLVIEAGMVTAHRNEGLARNPETIQESAGRAFAEKLVDKIIAATKD